jgi:hypothetical protein
MLDSNKSYSKRKQPQRRDQLKRAVKGRRWAGKASILENQNVHRRNKKTGWSPIATQKEQANSRVDAGWGGESQSGEWRARFLEGGFIIAAGLSDVVKNGMDHLLGLMRGGRDAVENVSIPPINFKLSNENDSLASDRVEPELEPGYDEGQNGEWLLDSEKIQPDQIAADLAQLQQLPDEPSIPAAELIRDSFEWSKMDSQDQEEFGLGEEELDDQAGALRSLFSNRDSET